MGIFNFFKNGNKESFTTENGIFGPTYLEDKTINIENPQNLKSTEWRRKLVSKSGQDKFKVKYYGDLDEKYKSLIVSTKFSNSMIIAVSADDEDEVLLFDGCKHGYDGIFSDIYSTEQVEKRIVDNFYIDKHGNDTFELIVSVYYNYNYNEEMSDEVDELGFIELDNGTKVNFEDIKRNGFDYIQILAKNIDGQTFEILSEELA